MAASLDGRYIVRLFRHRLEVLDGKTGAQVHELVGFGKRTLSFAIGTDLVIVSTVDGLKQGSH